MTDDFPPQIPRSDVARYREEAEKAEAAATKARFDSDREAWLRIAREYRDLERNARGPGRR